MACFKDYILYSFYYFHLIFYITIFTFVDSVLKELMFYQKKLAVQAPTAEPGLHVIFIII